MYHIEYSKILEKDFLAKRISKLLTTTIAKSEFGNTFVSKHLDVGQNGVKEDIPEAAEEVTANGVEEINGEKEDTKKVSKSSRVSSTKNTSFRLEQFSEDEEEGKPLVPQSTQEPAQTQRLSSEWLVSLFFMFLCPTILITLHNLCTSNGRMTQLNDIFLQMLLSSD